MSALTSIFNFLYVYVRLIFAYIFGSTVSLASFQGEQREIVRSIFNALNVPSETIVFSVQPTLILIIAIFALGALIGLVHRLMR